MPDKVFNWIYTSKTILAYVTKILYNLFNYQANEFDTIISVVDQFWSNICKPQYKQGPCLSNIFKNKNKELLCSHRPSYWEL